MSIQTIAKGVGGPIFSEFVGAPPGSCNVSVYDGDGDSVVTGVCTVDPVNTTSSATTLEEETTIPLTSVANIVSGRRYLFGNEEVSVKSIAGLVATLWAPLGRDHAIGTTFQGLRATYTVGAGDAAVAWADGYAIFTPGTGAPQTEALHCTKHRWPDVMISAFDTRKILPKEQLAFSSELDLDAAYRDARDNFLIDLGGKTVVNAIIGVAQFRRLVSMRFWMDRELEMGDQLSSDLTKFKEEYFRVIEKTVAVSPVDDDGDGDAESGPEAHALTGLDLETL